MEGDHHPRGGGVPGPRAHADFGAAQILGLRDPGLPEGEVLPDDLPEMGQREVQVPEPRILVQGVLRGHGRQEREEDRGVHPKSAQGRSGCRAAVDRL